MTEATGKRVIEELFELAHSRQFRRIKLKYAGGEALLQFKLLSLLHDYANQLAVARGIILEEVVLSSGVMISPDIAEWLKRTGMKLMISVDGVGKVNDRQRPLKKGGSSFVQLERNLTTVLLPHGIRPSLGITVTEQNAEGIAEVVKWALELELPFSLNLVRHFSKTAEKSDHDAIIIKGMKAAYQAIEANLPSRPFLNGLLDRVRSAFHTHTCGVGRDYVVITPRGEVCQCQMLLNQPVSNSLPTETVLSQWSKGTISNWSVEEKTACRECPYRYRCTGGCPLETYQITGSWQGRSQNCHIYKELYPAALRLEGLRLLKVHGESLG